MDLQQSSSDAFELLDESIRRWIWQNGWTELRQAQERAIPLILHKGSDVVICAPTSAGKTEAAFFPILTKILQEDAPSVRCVYISPLKALINDQFQRLDLLTETLNVPVHKWHGDVSASAKARLLKNPSGILLITPESLEALLMRQGSHVTNVFAHLEYVVIDEVHSFIGNERGAQLQSLLHRVECLVSSRIVRVGLSATLAEPAIAARFMRPTAPDNFSIVEDKGSGALKAQLRAFARKAQLEEPDSDEHESFFSADASLVRHFREVTKGRHNLVFCNRRSDVELYADALSESCRKDQTFDEYCAHHGNLSKEIRESAEARLKSKDAPTTCVCTSTLEMGIDIGSMHSVGQIGPPPSVASLRQRVGRSGRRGEAAILRAVVLEDEPTAKSDLLDRLHLQLIRAIASIELMTEGWCEPPHGVAYHCSTLVQQTMSLIVQRGGANIAFLYDLLIRRGPFQVVTQEEYIMLLRAMRERGLVQQMEDGTLLLGRKGERIAEHFSFYAAFSTPEEYQLSAEGKPIGTLPILSPVKPGDPLLFAGKRWVILEVDDDRKVITLRRSRGGRAPRFSGDAGSVHRVVRQKMKTILEGDVVPPYLDSQAVLMLRNARSAYAESGALVSCAIELGTRTLLFHWQGDREASTLRLLLDHKGLTVDPDPEVLIVEASLPDAVKAIAELLTGPIPADVELAASIKNKAREKYDWVLPEELLTTSFARNQLDLAGALDIARGVLSACDP